MKSKKSALLITMGLFLGIVITLVISANFDWTRSGVAADAERPQDVTLGTNEPVPQGLQGLTAMNEAFTKVAETVSPAVVTINSKAVVQQRRMNHPFFDDEFFRRFFNMPEQQEERILRGLGSGVIINPKGYILTNNHVVDEADEITVTFDGKEYEAEIVGTDPLTDLAVIKIENDVLPTLRLGDSDALQVGEWVLAIGNPFAQMLQHTVTAGIVSAKGRSGLPIGGGRGGGIQYQDFIQTDAAINPGNSGGALVNLRGELVGINTAILGQANVGIGFAIPINLAKTVVEQLIEQGRVVRGWLGVRIQPVDEDLAQSFGLDEATGVLISGVEDNSPAEEGGIKAEDIILEINDKEMESVEELQRVIAGIQPGNEIDVTVWRDNDRKDLTVTLGERPTQDQLASGQRTGEPSQPAKASALGLEVQNLTDRLAERLGYEEEQGVLVAGVKRNSVADQEGIREGDLITAVNRTAVSNVNEFEQQLSGVTPDDIVLFRLKRGNVSLFAALRVPEKE